MMNKTASQLDEFLNLLGLNPEEKSVYSALVSGSDLSVLQVAKNSGVNRTTAYRILERLKNLGLAEELVEENRIKFRKSGTDKLELLVKQQQEKAAQLNQLLPDISSLINQVSQTAQPGTKVLFYRGQEGIRQMVWNTLRTKKELIGYTFFPLTTGVGYDFAKQWHEEWVERKLKMRDIYSDLYLKNLKKEEEFHYRKSYFDTRYIPSNILNINHQVDIYNDLVAFYSWYDGEIFGVEIYNEKISAFHKQLFEIVWKMASPESQLRKKRK